MVLAEFSIYPLGKGESVSPFVARCLKVIEQSGLDYQCHAMGTTIEGELEQVMDVVERCVADVAADCDRVECVMKLDYRKGYAGELKLRVTRLEERLGRPMRN